jgi:hypothetical protein
MRYHHQLADFKRRFAEIFGAGKPETPPRNRATEKPLFEDRHGPARSAMNLGAQL